MAEDPGAPAAKDKPERRYRGFRQAGALIGPQTRAAAAKRGYADARLKALWPEIAGPELAALAAPVKLTPARGPAGGLLTLGVAGANGPRVQMLLPLIRERVNAALGPGAVGRVRLTQAARPAAAAGFAEAPAAFAPPPPADISAFAAPLSSIGDDDFRAALQTLAQNVVSQSRKTTVRPATEDS